MCNIYFFDEANGTLRTWLHDLGPTPYHSDQLHFELGHESIVGLAAATKQKAIAAYVSCRDVPHDPSLKSPAKTEWIRFNRRREYADEGFWAREVICLPIVSKSGQLVGVLQAINKQVDDDASTHRTMFLPPMCPMNWHDSAVDAFNDDDERIMQSLCNALTLVMHKWSSESMYANAASEHSEFDIQDMLSEFSQQPHGSLEDNLEDDQAAASSTTRCAETLQDDLEEDKTGASSNPDIKKLRLWDGINSLDIPKSGIVTLAPQLQRHVCVRSHNVTKLLSCPLFSVKA